MDRSAVQAIVERECGPLVRRLGLDGWEFKLSYAPEPADDDGSLKKGECTRLVDYRSACITFNPDAFDDEAGVIATLRHELFHCVLAPIDLYTSAIERLGVADPAGAILERVLEHSMEKAVEALEAMFVGLTAAREEA